MGVVLQQVWLVNLCLPTKGSRPRVRHLGSSLSTAVCWAHYIYKIP